ncbi:hypothetical protein F2Q70_00029658 [Brassica cretica]|uniref:Uncharacterized protein n=1 Tax=Brassica cretica TaxID=69181 RepID=A0A8S9FC29_BRACR|nr:hypothetical protein F2Q70_00029658 [Brassica cretica]
MDSGIVSLSGAVTWASDSESLFVEPSGVILPSSAFLARLVCACVPLGRLFISPGRAVGIQDEVFYASDLREVASEEFCG